MRKIFYFLLLVMLFSCEKEYFPRQEILIGTWIEQTQPHTKIIFTETQMYLFSGNIVDTLNYFLDGDKERLVLYTSEDPDKTTEVCILYDKKEEVLKIWDLFISIPEDENLRIYKKIN